VFDISEQSELVQPGEIRVEARRDEVERKLGLVRSWLEERGLAGVVLAGADAIAWVTDGLTTPIERGAAIQPLRVVITGETVAAVTTNVERPRLVAESGLGELGIPLAEAPWYEPDGLERVALELSERSVDELASDQLPGFACDCADDFVALRLSLSSTERARLEALALDAAAALEGALASWHPGETDLDLLARADEALERTAAFAACLIVGGDDRVKRFRHPLANGSKVHSLAMAVVVAERHGLHAALTRFVCAGGLPDETRTARDASLAVEEAMLAASASSSTYGDVLLACDRAYAETGYPGAWREHYQGGPIGYRQREFEIVPTDTASRWFGTEVGTNHALAWNPSIAGGGKAEDTYLREASGLRRLTDTGNWPLEHGRPAVLDIETGLAA
jgi:Xaa-Pro dipeptidase